MLPRDEPWLYARGDYLPPLPDDIRDKLEAVLFVWACKNDINPTSVYRYAHERYCDYHYGPIAPSSGNWDDFARRINTQQAVARRKSMMAELRRNGLLGDPHPVRISRHGRAKKVPAKPHPVDSGMLASKPIRQLIHEGKLNPFAHRAYENEKSGLYMHAKLLDGPLDTRTTVKFTVRLQFEFPDVDDRNIRFSYTLAVPQIRSEIGDQVTNGNRYLQYEIPETTSLSLLPGWSDYAEHDDPKVSAVMWLNRFGIIDRREVIFRGDYDTYFLHSLDFPKELGAKAGSWLSFNWR